MMSFCRRKTGEDEQMIERKHRHHFIKNLKLHPTSLRVWVYFEIVNQVERLHENEKLDLKVGSVEEDRRKCDVKNSFEEEHGRLNERSCWVAV